MWFYAKDEQQHGPMSAQGLKSLLGQQAVTPQTLVWRDGMANGLPMDQTELAAELLLPLPEGDTWETCAYSGDCVRRSEMVQIEGFWIASTHKDEVVDYLHQGGRLPKVELASSLTGCIELGHLVRSSWAMLMACLKPACALYLLVWIPGNLICSYVAAQNSTSSPGFAFQFGNLMQFLFGSVSTGGLLFLFSHHLRGMQPSLGEVLSAGFSNWGRLAVVRLLSGLMALLGFILLIIPGFIILFRTFLAESAAVDGQMNGSSAVQQSMDLTKGRFWLTLAYVLVVTLMCAWPLALFNAVEEQVPALNQWVVDGLVSTVLELPMIYLLAFTFCYYKELQAGSKPRLF